jgi:hypothetical protein
MIIVQIVVVNMGVGILSSGFAVIGRRGTVRNERNHDPEGNR